MVELTGWHQLSSSSVLIEESKSSTHHVSYNDTSVLSLEVGSRWLEIIEETKIAVSVTTKNKSQQLFRGVGCDHGEQSCHF